MADSAAAGTCRQLVSFALLFKNVQPHRCRQAEALNVVLLTAVCHIQAAGLMLAAVVHRIQVVVTANSEKPDIFGLLLFDQIVVHQVPLGVWVSTTERYTN